MKSDYSNNLFIYAQCCIPEESNGCATDRNSDRTASGGQGTSGKKSPHICHSEHSTHGRGGAGVAYINGRPDFSAGLVDNSFTPSLISLIYFSIVDFIVLKFVSK